MLILDTDRLSLYQFELTDAAFLLEVMNHPDYHRFIGDRGLCNVKDAEAYIEEKLIRAYEELGFGFWLARLRNSGEPVGLAGVLKREMLDSPDIGYAIHEEFRGKGLAREATCGVLKYAAEILGLHHVCAITSIDNQASINVLEKCGFEFSERRKVFEDDDELNVYKLTLQTNETLS